METNPHPPLFELANYRRTAAKMQKCKVTAIGWFGPHGRAVVLDEIIEAASPDARDWRSRGLVEFVV